MRKYISTNRTANSRSRIYQFFMLFDGQKQATKRAVPPARKTYKALLGNPWNCWKARTFPGSECRAPLPAASTSPAKFELVPAVSLFRLEPLPSKKPFRVALLKLTLRYFERRTGSRVLVSAFENVQREGCCFAARLRITAGAWTGRLSSPCSIPAIPPPPQTLGSAALHCFRHAPATRCSEALQHLPGLKSNESPPCCA